MAENYDQYWATLEGEDLLNALNHKIESYYDYVQQSGLHDVWRRSLIAYYGGDLNTLKTIFQSSKLDRAGKTGQLTKVKINDYRNLVKHAINLAVANKTSLNCVASNTDYKSQAQTVLGNSLLDYYLKVKKINFNIRKAVEFGCLLGEGWIHLPWKPKEGDVYDVDENGKPKYEGDLDATHHNPYDIIRDTNLRQNNDRWRIIREWRNKWELIAEYPELKEEILSEGEYGFEGLDSFRFDLSNGANDDDSDLIPLYTFYHNRTPAIREGKLTIFVNNTVLYEGDLPYDEMPLRVVMPDVLHETPFGYSPFNDLLNLQQASDNLASSLVSNNLTFGTQFLWKRKGDGFSVKNVEGGLKMLESEEKPEGMNLTRSAPETYQLLDVLGSKMETLSGISSTVRGSPQANLKSGSALALVVAQSIQFGSDLEESANALLSDVGSTIVDHLKSFAETPRVALITGEANRPFMKEFTGNDIGDIQRVTVEQTNALSKTISGRLEIAQQVMTMPPEMAKTYMSILNTGQLPTEMQTPSSLMSIKAENENLRNNQSVRAIVSENHPEHIKQHMTVIDNPEAKENEELVSRTLAHVQEHLDLWRSMNPDLVAIMGMPPAPQSQGQVPVSQVPSNQQSQAVPGNPLNKADAPNVDNVLSEPADAMPNMPNMPNMPENTDPTSQQAYEQSLGG